MSLNVTVRVPREDVGNRCILGSVYNPGSNQDSAMGNVVSMLPGNLTQVHLQTEARAGSRQLAHLAREARVDPSHH